MRNGCGRHKGCDIGTLRASYFCKTVLIFSRRWHRKTRFNLAKIKCLCAWFAIPVLASCRDAVGKGWLRAVVQGSPGRKQSISSWLPGHKQALQGVPVKTTDPALISC